ncbi:hypothetical protein OG819_04995 [Streptomyces sp. NBC_01549]|uniref:hypothetical protein n=1 Tax=Streptomyces sp. NBC_01549 TaxID=2975874 RepID=UPI00225527B8|nr:hypothetical protein [Streptomyces sp. NBC_01549]MCX4589126.1 hypothetical protein [Streptomyces sp. NBC_01549]
MRGTRAACGTGDVPGLRAAAGDVHTVGIAGVDGDPADPALGAEQDTGRGEDLLVVLDPGALETPAFGHKVLAGHVTPQRRALDALGPACGVTGSPSSPARCLSCCCGAWGSRRRRSPRTTRPGAARTGSCRAGRRLLVLLDNAASAEQVRPLLPGSPSCCVVVTSRNRLGDLVVRDGAHTLPLDLLRPAEAHALLSEVLGAERTGSPPNRSRPTN